MAERYRICKRCIMDTTDTEITFDDNGICSHCQRFDNTIKPQWHPNQEGEAELNRIVENIKRDCRNRRYDCIIGLSGGIDSSYLAYWGKKVGLRMLAIHVDGGWNSELAVKNIENICRKLDIDLYTHVIDWEEMKELQLAYLRSGVANQDVPQDHAFISALYKYAIKNHVKYVLGGFNYATESVLPSSWGYNAMDKTNLMAIFNRFGKGKLKTYPTTSFMEYYFYYPHIKGMKVIKPLNYMDYHKGDAIKVLEEKLDWQYYGGKHHESRFTKFFQAYYLPEKFNYDKRRAHLSSLILAGQMTREQALEEMEHTIYTSRALAEDKEYISKKLDITNEELERLISLPNHSYSEFKSDNRRRMLLYRVKRFISKKDLV